MPVIEYFPYRGPNRRTDRLVVEILLKFNPEDESGFPHRLSDIRDLLVSNGVITADEAFPARALPAERQAWYTSLLVQTALLFQQKSGHRVNYFSIEPLPEQNRCLALMEHEHCDVGMTAVKLAFELLTGKRRMLAEPFRMFSKFAGERLLPVETEAVIEAARQRGIPTTHLERHPFSRAEFDTLTGGRCVSPNGLLALGHGARQRVIDGAYCLDTNEDFSAACETARQEIINAGGSESRALEAASHTLLDRLFPGTGPWHMPIVAITGTNGKTTTTRMVNHIMTVAGRKPGMVCTDGIFVNGEAVAEGDFGTRAGHLKVLLNKAVDCAVLETHHGGILTSGFAFESCDVAVCLNVTEDHLGQSNIETVEQMAGIKRALPERARDATVLFADDEHTLAMLAHTRARRKCLVSLQSSRDQLLERHGDRMNSCCVIEDMEGRDCMVIYDRDLRLPVIPVNEIPATCGGLADFMTSNAMHAAAAGYFSGVGVESIRRALGSFEASYKNTPGRLNVFDDLPFRVIMDFAHNPDGMRRVCDFIDRQKPVGRKLVAFAGSINRTDETIRRMGQSLAGHFDFYFCKEHVRPDGTQPRLVAHILQQGLMDKGVAEDRTAILRNGRDVIFEIFDACRPGDLLLMLMGHVEKHQLPGYIEEYAEILRARRQRVTNLE